MRRLHIVLLSLAIAFGVAGTNAWAQRGGGGHGGGGGGFHGGGGGGFRGGYGGGGFRGGYGGYRGGYGGWGYGRGWGGWGYGFRFGLGWGPWAYWPYAYYGGWGYPYYSSYPYSSYYPDYSSNPCYPYGPYDCRISGYGPTAYAPDPAAAGPNAATYSQRSISPSPYSQQSASPVTRTAYLGDGQWHHFGAQPAPAIRATSPQAVPHPQASEPVRTYNVSLTEGR
jgi:hypothetical protein